MDIKLENARREDVGPLWWALEGRGVLAVLFGLLALLWPGISLSVLVVLFGVYALVDGIVSIMALFTSRRKGLYLVLGIAGIAAGVLTFMYPAITLLALAYIIGVWAIVTGAFQVATAATGETMSTSHRWLWGISGALAILFGILLFANPIAGVLSVGLLIGFYALMYGIAQIMLGFDLRNVGLAERTGQTVT